MISLLTPAVQRRVSHGQVLRRFCQIITFPVLFLLCPVLVFAQSGSPFDTGFTVLQNLFTGTIAKVASLIAIVIGGYQFAHGEPGAQKALAGVATGWSALAARATLSRRCEELEEETCKRSRSCPQAAYGM
jgi:type IV secretory pathway VirB2 component (pilin)